MALPSFRFKDRSASHTAAGQSAKDATRQSSEVQGSTTREVRILYWTTSARVPETTIVDVTIGKFLNVRRWIPSVRFGGMHWFVQVWNEDLGEWISTFRWDVQVKIARHTVTVLVRELDCHVCLALGREVEIQQMRRGIEKIEEWEPVDLRVPSPTKVGEDFTVVSWDATGAVPQVFIVTLTNQGRLIIEDFPQLAEHCFHDRHPRPVFCGTRVWNPRTLKWELQSELLDYFPLKGYNF
ncbi:hypothetical protein BD310DRAFT_983020, partial [Dichomitus squalens]